MVLRIVGRKIYKDGIVVGFLSNEADDEVEKSIEFGSEAAPAVQGLLDKLKSRNFKRRETVRELETLISKHQQ